MLEAYARFPLLKSVIADANHQLAPTDAESLLADSRLYLQYLSERFHAEHYDEAIELESHRWMNDPVGMKDLIVSHVRAMWNEYMADEWERTRRLLADCVEAYRQIDLSGLSSLEAAQKVVGRELDEHWHKMLATAQRVIFVPSAHVGPYLMKIGVDQTLYMLFGARQPAGVQGTSPDLSRSELLVRLVALADDTRLRILDLLARRGEMCSPDIIREERRGFQEATGAGPRELAFKYTWYFFCSRRLNTRYVGVGQQAGHCTAVYIRDSKEGGPLYGHNLDDIRRPGLENFQPPKEGPDGKRRLITGGVSSAVLCDEEPTEIGRASCREKCRSRWSPYH